MWGLKLGVMALPVKKTVARDRANSCHSKRTKKPVATGYPNNPLECSIHVFSFFFGFIIYIYSICRFYYTTINLWGLFHEGSAISVSFSQAVDPHFSHGPSACAVPRVDGIRQGPTMCANEQRRFANLVDW
jgi:hypothetical protein